ncbi:SDK [Mytilus edulis]|uniref:SDK n=1 Tax=Mytilus edulis TaxID=6550 RepID=A0A8S3UFY0_MYTED|nr:SDK [Mytilus edulis]
MFLFLFPELPFKPVITNIAVPPTALKSANISFSPGPNGNTPIERFIFQKRMVTYYPDKGVTMGEDEGWETYPQDVAPNVRFFVMPNLRPARYFQFRLKSVNKVGVGPASDAKPNTPLLMPEQPPEAAPRGFYGSPRSNSSIMLNWQAPPSDTWNGDLTGYKVKYRLKGYTSPFLERNTNPWPSTSFELTGLIVFTEYEIKIAAYNNEGVGLYSDSINVRTREGVPGVPPTDVNVSSVNSTAIKIVWLPPDASKINGVNLGYIILAKGPGNIEERLTVPPDPTDPYNFQQAFMYNLKKFTDYTITVTCYTGQGPGPASTPVHIKTEEDVPDEVVHLSFTDIFDTSVKVIWQHPVEVNGILTGYTLLWEKKNQNKTRKDINLSNTTLTYTVRDLDPTTKYTIYIYGKTSKGAGKNSSADFESGVPPERPGAPYNLGISDIQARSTLLQFLLGYDGKTSITLWRIHGQIDNNDTWVPVYEISDPDARTILVPNLRPFTMYRLRITAVNIVGPGNYSAPSRQFQTAQAPPNVPPDNVTVRAINSTALRISWAPLSQLNWNGYPRGYRMIYKRKDEVNTHEVVLDTDSESYTLAKLEEWMEYEVKMNAYNDVGSSPFSPISTERTRDAKPSHGPVAVTADAVSSTAINVPWGDGPLDDRNGIILGYRVMYKSLSENIKDQYKDVPGNETYYVLLTNLRKYVEYQVQVLAYTRMGDGVLSQDVLSVQTDEDGKIYM